MTDISITAANVIAGSNATRESGTAGATITAGQVVYRDGTTGQYKLADTDAATAEVRTPRGIALYGASAGQPLTIIRAGDVTIGATIVAGVAYYLSGTAGGICPIADVAADDYPAIIGMGKSTTVLTVSIQAPDAKLVS
jgi:hypothetical protein